MGNHQAVRGERWKSDSEQNGQTFDRLDDLLHHILATGAQVKDINTGLLDFSALKDGREVYLCWRYGEEEIEYWHEVEAGFAGRQPIDLF